jgi:GNAT superfamily N-acetyltransferase
MEAGLNARIKSAEALALLFLRKELAAIAALKRPANQYKHSVFEKACSLDAIPDLYRFELGWVYVAERFRNNGYSKYLLKDLLQSREAGGVYATSITENVAMHRSLEREGFIRIGETWPSTNQPGKLLCLFVKDD